MNDQHQHGWAIVGSVFTVISWNWILLVLGAAYWVVMIWATIRRDRREAEKAKREATPPGHYPPL